MNFVNGYYSSILDQGVSIDTFPCTHCVKSLDTNDRGNIDT